MKHEPFWRVVVLWYLWPLRWRNSLWFWVEEHTRWGVKFPERVPEES